MVDRLDAGAPSGPGRSAPDGRLAAGARRRHPGPRRRRRARPAARLRTVLRDVREIVDQSDPRDTWDGDPGLAAPPGRCGRRRQPRPADRRAPTSSATQWPPQFNLESGEAVELELDSVTRALAELELPSASTFSMPGGRLGSLLVERPARGVRAADGVELALHTTLLIMPRRRRLVGAGRRAASCSDGGQAPAGLPAGPGEGGGGQVHRRGRVRDEQGHPRRAAADPAAAARRVPGARRPASRRRTSAALAAARRAVGPARRRPADAGGRSSTQDDAQLGRIRHGHARRSPTAGAA